MSIKQSIEAAALNKAIDYLFEDPQTNAAKIMNTIDKAVPNGIYPSQRKSIRKAIDEKNNWYQLIMRMGQLAPGYAQRLAKTFVVDGNLTAWETQEENRVKYNCNIPWAILLDPTSACNLHCTGCWAADYGSKLNLSFDEIDSIIEQGKALGTHVYIYTGGEPLVRKADLIKLCEKHQDCAFLSFTNSTLIDEKFCQDMLRVANFVPAISVEGFEEATDSRRGAGTFQKTVEAMKLLREHGLAFGTSCCYTSANYESIGSEEFIDWMIEQGALFSWFFTYMPIGTAAPTDLMVDATQREHMYHFIRKMRETKPLFTMDFWNDGEFVGGCIAGGRRYLHINAAGNVEPCVFAHYSNCNIRETPLLDALRSPLFMQYHDEQPFNDNLLRPCPILDNEGTLAKLVEKAGAESTDLKGAEKAEELCAKCAPYAQKWAPIAEKLWTDPQDERHEIRESRTSGLADSDMEKLRGLGRR